MNPRGVVDVPLWILVDRSPTVGEYLHAYVGDRDKNQVVLAVRGDRVGGFARRRRRWRWEVDEADKKARYEPEVIGIDDRDVRRQFAGGAWQDRTAKVHPLLPWIEPDLVAANAGDGRQDITTRDPNDVAAACHETLVRNEDQPRRPAGRGKDIVDKLSGRV